MCIRDRCLHCFVKFRPFFIHNQSSKSRLLFLAAHCFPSCSIIFFLNCWNSSLISSSNGMTFPIPSVADAVTIKGVKLPLLLLYCPDVPGKVIDTHFLRISPLYRIIAKTQLSKCNSNKIPWYKVLLSQNQKTPF